jgi:hypothetical protein
MIKQHMATSPGIAQQLSMNSDHTLKTKFKAVTSPTLAFGK